MPAILIPLLQMLAAGGVEQAGSALLRRIFAKNAGSLTAKAAQAAAAKVAGSGVGRAVDAGMAGLKGAAPGWLASRMGSGPIASNAVQLGSLMGKNAMMMGGFAGAEIATEALMGGRGAERRIDGWEAYQGQQNPVARDNMLAMGAIQDDAQMKHLQRALSEALAAKREQDSAFGGLM